VCVLQVFTALGEKGKVHKVRASAELSSDIVNEVKAGDDVVVITVAEALNTKGEEVDRYECSAPVMGWVSASNFKLAMDPAKQEKKHMAKLEKMLKGKDLKRKKAIEAEAKKHAKAAEKAAKEKEKADKKAAEAAKKAAKDAPKLEKARLKAEAEAAAAAKAAAEAEGAAAASRKKKAECYGAWIAKGDKGIENTVRKDAAMDSMKVGKVLGGQKVNVIGQAEVKKSDGTMITRLNINVPKAGWISAANFEQVEKAN